ncbi:MAG: alpha/beta hydrolase family protein [Burkholderiales bacterium]
MRIFEILLLATLLTGVVLLFLPAARRPAWRQALPWLGLALIALHLLIEGYRWQMVPAYALTAILLLAGLRARAAAPPPASRWRTALRITGATLCVLIVVIAAAASWLFPVFELPMPSGPHAVGTAYLHLTDSAREESFTEDQNDHRELMVQLWYPTDAASGSPAPYLQDPRQIGRRMAHDLRVPPFLFDHFNLIRTHATLDAALAPGGARYPVLIFSHGYAQGVMGQNTVQMQELASHGYVVASIAHPYEGLLAIFPDGHAIPAKREHLDAFRNEMGPLVKPWAEAKTAEEKDARFREWVAGAHLAAASVKLWAEDTSFVIDELTRLNAERFGQLLDLERIGVFGMSFGGTTAGQVCLDDPRVKAGLNLDGTQLGEVLGHALRQPFMFMYNSNGGGDRMNHLIYEQAAGPAYQVTVAGTTHFSYTDFSLWSPAFRMLGLLGPIEGPRMQQIMNAYVLAFFNRYLKGGDSTLLDAASPDYPEVRLESRNAGAAP